MKVGVTFDSDVVVVESGEHFFAIGCVFARGMTIKSGATVQLDGCTFLGALKIFGLSECSKCVFRAPVRVVGPAAKSSFVACDFFAPNDETKENKNGGGRIGLLCCSGGHADVGRGCRVSGWPMCGVCSVGRGSQVVMRNCQIDGDANDDDDDANSDDDERDWMDLLEQMQRNERNGDGEDFSSFSSFGAVACAGGSLRVEHCQVRRFSQCGLLSLGGGKSKSKLSNIDVSHSQEEKEGFGSFNSSWGCHSCDSSDDEDRDVGEGLRCVDQCRILQCQHQGVMLHRTTQCVISDSSVSRVQQDGLCVAKKSSCSLLGKCEVQQCRRGLVVVQMATKGVGCVEVDNQVRFAQNENDMWTCWSEPIMKLL